MLRSLVGSEMCIRDSASRKLYRAWAGTLAYDLVDDAGITALRDATGHLLLYVEIGGQQICALVQAFDHQRVTPSSQLQFRCTLRNSSRFAPKWNAVPGG